jgi:hypothetical protein
MLNAVIDKLEDADEADRKHYKPLDGGGFYADVGGLGEGTKHPSVGELVRAKKRESEAATAKAAEAATLKADLEKAREDMRKRLTGKVDKSDLEALESDYNKRIADLKAESDKQLCGRDAIIRDRFVESEARTLATAIALDANAADLLAESVQRRLSVEITTEGKAVTRVLGVDGKPSAASLDDLKKEIVATPKYHALLSGSKASGSGATSGSSGSGAPSGKTDWLHGKPADVAAAATKKNPQLGG